MMTTFDDRELEGRVNEVLFYVWDPIGVSHEPCARGEYDSYVPQVLKLLVQDERQESISAHLAEIVKDAMGLVPDRKQCDHTAELLLKHKRAIRKGLA